MRNQFIILALLSTFVSSATTWLVGPTRTYTMPSQVSTLVGNGDTVLIDAGIYNSDVAYWSASNLVLNGVGGFAHLKSNGLSYGDKAIWVIGGNNTKIEYIEFSLCTSTSLNGAGIRQEGSHLTVSHCYFHDNENGILAGTVNPSNIIVEYSEFNNNGAGDGFSHNLYINYVDTLVFQYNYSHHCTVGHELKSRAKVNYILYNRLSNESTGDASREMDLPNGGACYVIGNIIEQGPNSQNSGIVGYGLEGLTSPAPHNLYFINNTVVNDRSTGTFVALQSGTDLYKAYNNIFAGPGTILNGTPTTLDTTNNLYCTIGAAAFVNATGYDYHLISSSPAINGGTIPGFGGSVSLTPVFEYVHANGLMVRSVNGALDIGAHEYNGGAGISNLSGPELNVFPNPNNGTFRIANLKNKEVGLYNTLGEKIPLRANGDIFETDVPNGIYFLEIKQEERTGIKKLVIEK